MCPHVGVCVLLHITRIAAFIIIILRVLLLVVVIRVYKRLRGIGTSWVPTRPYPKWKILASHGQDKPCRWESVSAQIRHCSSSCRSYFVLCWKKKNPPFQWWNSIGKKMMIMMKKIHVAHDYANVAVDVAMKSWSFHAAAACWLGIRRTTRMNVFLCLLVIVPPPTLLVTTPPTTQQWQ